MLLNKVEMMNIVSLIAGDPVLGLESVTLIFTSLYLAKLMFRDALSGEEQLAAGSNKRRQLFPEEHSLWSLFSVGSLISLPKRSLWYQNIA